MGRGVEKISAKSTALLKYRAVKKKKKEWAASEEFKQKLDEWFSAMLKEMLILEEALN